jgi:transcriptional regulator of acetoin/glycerol metabolism|tara:strand:- start:509 stop:790 length:282 start_codon:yes stop_codon:yes gene_type:complete
MAKFLSIPVTDEQKQLVSADDVVLCEQASVTTTTIVYQGGKVVTITHATVGSNNETMRDYIQDSIVLAQQQPWHQVKYECDALPQAVSGIAVA